MKLRNSLPDNIRHLDLSWTIRPSAENASVLTKSAAPTDLYFTALTINLLTYFTKEATQTIHHFVQNCSRCIENYRFKHKNLVGCRELRPLTPTGGSDSGPPLGAPPQRRKRRRRPQTPIIGSRFRALHGCVFDSTFLYPPGPLYGPLPSSFIPSFSVPSSELRRITHENVEL